MDWNRKRFKTDAKITLKNNYRILLVVCILLMLISNDFSETKEQLTGFLKTTTEETDSLNRLNTNGNKRALNDFLNGLDRASRAKDHLVHQVETYHPTRGVLASVFNSATGAGGLSESVLNSANQIFFKGKIGAGLIIILASLLKLAAFTFIGNVIFVGGRRIFLESRRYYDTDISRIFFPYQIKRALKVGLAMLRKSIYETLWLLTIVGFFIKKYSYAMVPFILAENPDIGGKDAIELSRRMMNGYKWKLFVLDLTFLGWTFLSALTFGLVGICFLNPYQTATYAEVYMELRKEARINKMPLSEFFNDRALAISEASSRVYPVDSYPIQVPKSRKWINVDYKKTYSLLHIVLLFFTFSFIGWLWEVSLHLLKDGVFVNRGVLFGPWLPIYGAGSILVIILLKPFRDNRLLTFLLSIVLCGVVEYVSSWYLQVSHGMKWWDYSGYFLNINGRICAESLLTFGLGCYAIIYIVAPLFDNLFDKIPKKTGLIIAIILLILFTIDGIHSKSHPNTGKGITDYKSFNNIGITHMARYQ